MMAMRVLPRSSIDRLGTRPRASLVLSRSLSFFLVTSILSDPFVVGCGGGVWCGVAPAAASSPPSLRLIAAARRVHVVARCPIPSCVPIYNLDLLTCTKDDAKFASDFTLTASRNDYCHALVAYFECAFTQVRARLLSRFLSRSLALFRLALSLSLALSRSHTLSRLEPDDSACAARGRVATPPPPCRARERDRFSAHGAACVYYNVRGGLGARCG